MSSLVVVLFDSVCDFVCQALDLLVKLFRLKICIKIQQVLRHQICSLLMTSLRTDAEVIAVLTPEMCICDRFCVFGYVEDAFHRKLFFPLIVSMFNQPEGEAGEPSYRRLVLRSVAHIIRLYSSSLITECEVCF